MKKQTFGLQYFVSSYFMGLYFPYFIGIFCLTFKLNFYILFVINLKKKMYYDLNSNFLLFPFLIVLEGIYLNVKVTWRDRKRERKRGREGERKREIFCLLVPFSDGCDFHWCSRPKSGVQSCVRVTHVGGRSPGCWPPFTAFLSPFKNSWMGSVNWHDK